MASARIRAVFLGTVVVLSLGSIWAGFWWQVAFVKTNTPSDSPTNTGDAPTAVTRDLEGASRWNKEQGNVSEQQAGVPRLFIITVQTKPSPGWCKMLLSHFLTNSARSDGAQPVVINLGWGEAYGHAKRPAWILQWLEEAKLRDEDVVLFADGSDTVFTGVPRQEILKRFVSATLATKQLASGGGAQPGFPALLFNAEANCFHQQTFSGPWGVKKGRCILAYDELHNQWSTTTMNSSVVQGMRSKFRYLNAGAWIGRVWAVREVFGEAGRRIAAGKGKFWCDQSVIGGILLGRVFDHITTLGIDQQNQFFLPTYHVQYGTDVCSPQLPQGSPKRIQMCASGGTPAVLHFNGKSASSSVLSKQLLAATPWWQENSTTQAEQLKRALGPQQQRRQKTASRQSSNSEATTNLVSLSGGISTRVVSLSEHCSSMAYPQG